MINYYMQEQAEQFNFYMLPKALMKSKKLSDQAKLMYIILRDQISLSAKNSDRYTDDKGRIYIIYGLVRLCDDMNMSKGTAIKKLNELVENNLIEIVKMGVGKANRIYVGDFVKFCQEEAAEEKARAELIKKANVKNTSESSLEPSEEGWHITSNNNTSKPFEVEYETLNEGEADMSGKSINLNANNIDDIDDEDITELLKLKYCLSDSTDSIDNKETYGVQKMDTMLNDNNYTEENTQQYQQNSDDSKVWSSKIEHVQKLNNNDTNIIPMEEGIIIFNQDSSGNIQEESMYNQDINAIQNDLSKLNLGEELVVSFRHPNSESEDVKLL